LVNNRRSEIEIIGEILRLSSNGAKKTELLYQGNFSYAQLQSYLSYLIERDILEESEAKNNGNLTKYYKTTEKGLLFLQDVERVLAHLDL
jgi:predicted transcriptional regulator